MKTVKYLIVLVLTLFWVLLLLAIAPSIKNPFYFQIISTFIYFLLIYLVWPVGTNYSAVAFNRMYIVMGIDEYNALKHGFRVRHGGFTLRAGVESVYGVAPPEAEMRTLGESKFGAKFLKIDSLGISKGNPNIRSRHISLNWSLERVVLLLQLVHMSINNIVSALKVVNNYAPSDCRFIRPENNSDFDKPWAYSTGVTSINFDYVLEENSIPSISKTELLTMLRAK